MRLNLVIQRHGLPVSRILWTTTPASLSGGTKSRSSYAPASSSVTASTRTPNAAFANGYTIAHLLEDVNEVVPLETELEFAGDGHCGSWGLEDYVVEVGGFECLHFMEVDGLLRDDDEVVIRALQTSDLRTRRLSGRHQISTDGRHLIDGVPFGKAYLKRPTSSRPAITIPPRKKRRTTLSNWARDAELEGEDDNWAPREHEAENDQLYADEGTVIRHDVHEADENPQSLESDADISEYEDEDEDEDENENEDLQQELSGLKEDMESSDLHGEAQGGDQEMSKAGYALRSRTSSQQEPLRKGSVPSRASLAGNATNVWPAANFVPRTLHLRSSSRQKPAAKNSSTKSPSVASSVPQSLEEDGSPRGSKIVRFQDHKKGQIQAPPESQGSLVKREPSIAEKHTRGDRKEREYSESTSPSSVSSDTSSVETESTGEEEGTSESEEEPAAYETDEESTSESEDDTSESESESSSESGVSGVSDKDGAISGVARKAEHHLTTSAPGDGTSRTKKTNRRNKVRRKLAKLKQLGALPPQADFAALHDWESVNGSWYYPPDAQVPETNGVMDGKRSKKEQEQLEFEEKRYKLLRQLESGGVDIDGVSEEHDHKRSRPPPRAEEVRESTKATEDFERQRTDERAEGLETERVKKRALDVASSRRLLFGSLGVRTPRTKEDEEATRKKLAGKIKQFQPQRRLSQPDSAPPEIDSDLEENWQEKLVTKATECIFDDIELSAPPFPFQQRWDREAHEIIRKRKGWGKNRKKRRRAQMYEEGGEEEYDANNDYENGGDVQLNYDDAEQAYNDEIITGNGTENERPTSSSGDLPNLPDNLGSVSDLAESEMKPGLIIAYKQLDLSKATHWQPKVSEYRVAEVQEFVENGVFTVRLSKRDRIQPIHDAGEEDAPREYSGFDMPGFEDDEKEDDGFREVSFGELIEPKLLQGGAHTETEAMEPEDAQGVIMSETFGLPDKSSYGTQDSSRKLPVVAVEVESRPVSTIEETQDITLKPKDVGRMTQEVHVQNELASKKIRSNWYDGARSSDPDVIQSPTFAGFQESPSSDTLKADGKNQRVANGPNAIQRETDFGRKGNHSNAAQDRPHSPISPEPLDDMMPTEGTDENWQRDDSSDGSTSSFDHLRNLFKVKRPENNSQNNSPGSERDSRSSRYASPENTMVPNPFYSIDKAREKQQDEHDEHDDQRTPGELQDTLTTNWEESQVERLPSRNSILESPLSHERHESPARRESSAGFETADKEPETPLTRRRNNRAKKSNTPPNPTQTSEIVDLTGSSPAVSPSPESDPDYIESDPLPRRPGWVQKNDSTGRRPTRSSGGRVQVLEEVSISSPRRHRKAQ